jgi:type I restriction enzyme M protein
VKTVVLFFKKGAPTSRIWYYQLDPKRNLGKTNPLNESDLADFLALQKSKADSKQSWSLEVNEVDENSIDLSVRNPNTVYEETQRSPQELLSEIEALDAESTEILMKIRSAL